MPTYRYQCKKCGKKLEEFQSITAPPLVRCPKCKTNNLVREIGAGSGLIFKGSGFYQTDYKKDIKKESKKAEKPADKKEAKKEEKKEKKPERPSSANSTSEKKD